MTDEVTFDVPKYLRLRRAHRRALAAGREEFEFEGKAYLTAFAGYLLQHLESELMESDRG